MGVRRCAVLQCSSARFMVDRCAAVRALDLPGIVDSFVWSVGAVVLADSLLQRGPNRCVRASCGRDQVGCVGQRVVPRYRHAVWLLAQHIGTITEFSFAASVSCFVPHNLCCTYRVQDGRDWWHCCCVRSNQQQCQGHVSWFTPAGRQAKKDESAVITVTRRQIYVSTTNCNDAASSSSMLCGDALGPICLRTASA